MVLKFLLWFFSSCLNIPLPFFSDQVGIDGQKDSQDGGERDCAGRDQGQDF